MRAIKKTKAITNRDSDQVRRYFNEVSRYPIISVEEEVELARKIRKGEVGAEKAKQKLVEANLRFVINVANQYACKDMDLLDLISEGNLGLIKAAERFDETRGFKFISYAVWWIRQSILSALAEKSRVIHCPLNVQGLLSKYRKANELCIQKENRPLSVEEFCFDNELDDKVIKALNSVLMPVVSMSQMVGETGTTIEDFIISEEDDYSNLEYESFSHDIEVGLSSLNTKEKDIIVKSFGLGCAAQSLDDIAFRMNLSRERVRQIRIKALKKLKGSESIGHLKSYL